MILEPKKIQFVLASTISLSVCHEVMGLDAMILVFWMLSFKPGFTHSSFTLIKRFFSSSSLYAIRVISSTYLRLLMILPPILIPACNSSSLAFLMMCSEYRLSKQWQQTALSYSFLSLEPSSFSTEGSNCYFLTFIQVSQEAGKVVWYSHFFNYFLQFVVIHKTKALV